MSEEIDPLRPSSAILCKLGSIVVHVQEGISAAAHTYDWIAVRILLDDPEIKAWLKAMGPLVPKTR